jgi:alcohol dehydrogenase (cytochrome c)
VVITGISGGEFGTRDFIDGWDAQTGQHLWRTYTVPGPGEPGTRCSGVLSTAGGIVFSGQLTGEFEAFDADTGKKLWQFRTGSGIEGQPVTWQQDGVQYVAVTSGIGGSYLIFTGDQRLASVPAGGSLWVFALAPQ